MIYQQLNAKLPVQSDSQLLIVTRYHCVTGSIACCIMLLCIVRCTMHRLFVACYYDSYFHSTFILGHGHHCVGESRIGLYQEESSINADA